jgi:hypothetical protein
MQRPPPHHVSRQQLKNLCLGAGADLSEGLLDLVTSLCRVSCHVTTKSAVCPCSRMGLQSIDTLSKQRTCFLIFMTLNRSKSFRPRLFCIAVRFLAHALSSNCCWTLCSSHFFATWPTPLARGSLGMTIGVRESFASATSWRGTKAFSEGPSTSTCSFCKSLLSAQFAGCAYALVVDDLDDGS